MADQLRAGYAYAALRSLTFTSAREQAQGRLLHSERRLNELAYAVYGLTEAEIFHIKRVAG